MSVKDMTNEQLNIALDVLLGAKVDRGRPGNVIKGNYSASPTDYCTDPAASLEVQAKALMTAGKEYTKCLTKILTDSFEIEVPENDPYWIATLVLTATPRQRAEAAYMTLSSQNQVNTED